MTEAISGTIEDEQADWPTNRFALATPGAWAEHGDGDELSGRDVQKLRACMDKAAGHGAGANALCELTLALLVTAWNIPYLPGAQVPGHDPKVLGILKGRDMVALEEKIMPMIDWMRKKKDENDPPN